MHVQLGQMAPDFTAVTTEGDVRFHDWRDGAWAVLFSHPADFTPVCTTELGEVARLTSAFDARDTRVMALSVDDLADHRAWVADIEQTQRVAVDFPIVADRDGVVAHLYGMIHEDADPKLTVRSVYVIGSDGTVKATLTYPPSAGRNFDEILRLVDSLQLTATQGLATPVNWRSGEPVIISPSIDDETARARFGEFDAPRPYLRYVEGPSVPSKVLAGLAGTDGVCRDRLHTVGFHSCQPGATLAGWSPSYSSGTSSWSSWRPR